MRCYIITHAWRSCRWSGPSHSHSHFTAPKLDVLLTRHINFAMLDPSALTTLGFRCKRMESFVDPEAHSITLQHHCNDVNSPRRKWIQIAVVKFQLPIDG